MKLKNKVRFIEGKNINLREVDVTDAEFVLSLRTNADLNKFISKTEYDLDKQIRYIQDFKRKEDEYYFIIDDNTTNESYGTGRVYDIKEKSFGLGSWIIKKEAPANVAIESILLIYEFGFYTLDFNQAHYDVRKDNKSVISFHKRMGAEMIGEDDLNYYFIYSQRSYELIKPKYSRFIK